MISVLVAMYNVENCISQCLASLLNQTYTDFEVICVDDGSTDNTRKVVEQHSDSRIKYFYKKNGGASSARNFGLSQSSGSYICMVDADDYISTDSFSLLMKGMNSAENIDSALFDLIFIEQDGEFNKFDMSRFPRVINGVDASIHSINWRIHGLGLFKRSLFDYVKYDESNLHGDELTTRKLLFYSNNIVLTDAKYFYVQHSNASTLTYSLKRFGILDNLIALYGFFKEKGLIDKCSYNFDIEFSRVVFGLAKLLFHNRTKITINDRSMIIKKMSMCSNLISHDFIRDGLPRTGNFKENMAIILLSVGFVRFFSCMIKVF